MCFQLTFTKKSAGGVYLFEISKEYMTVWFDADLDIATPDSRHNNWLEHKSP